MGYTVIQPIVQLLINYFKQKLQIPPIDGIDTNIVFRHLVAISLINQLTLSSSSIVSASGTMFFPSQHFSKSN